MIEENAAGVDNRRGKEHHAEEEEASTLTPTPAAVNSSRILAKTLEYMAAQSIENKRQQLAEMGMRNIRDKLVARRWNEDGILQQLNRLSRAKRSLTRLCLTSILRLKTKSRRSKNLTSCNVRNIVATAT